MTWGIYNEDLPEFSFDKGENISRYLEIFTKLYSYGTPKSFSTVQADFTTGQSLSEPMMIATFFIRFETSLTKQTAQCSASGYTALWCRRKKGMMVQNTREEANTLHCVCHGRSPLNKSKMCPVLVV